MENDIASKAREFARAAHADQKRKYTHRPYFDHLEEVARMVEGAGLPPETVAAAYLHDVVEDQPVTLKQIGEMFGLAIAGIVQDLTGTSPGPGLNREKRNAIDLQRLAAASADTQSIKCADLISNTSTIVRYDPGFAKRYLPEKRAILEVLTKADAGLHAKAMVSLLAAEMHLPLALEEKRVEKGLEKFFGGMVYDWTPIPRRRARWWQFSARRSDARVDAALASVGRGPFTDEMSDAYWHQVRLGQIYEDAGGYLWRCWCAALKLPFVDVEKPYDDRSAAMVSNAA